MFLCPLSKSKSLSNFTTYQCFDKLINRNGVFEVTTAIAQDRDQWWDLVNLLDLAPHSYLTTEIYHHN